MKLSWYWNRLRRMSPAEILHRSEVAARQRLWAKASRRPKAPVLPTGRVAKAALHRPNDPALLASPAAQRLIATANRLLAGEMDIFHLRQTGIAPEPDWFLDPLTGRRTPPTQYCFTVPYRDESKVGNIKYLWEASRHQGITQLATAWWLTGDDAYAERAALHLRSWWRDNPFLQGVHWVSGIEVGLRLLAWSWTRALLADWSGCAALFDDNAAFHTQLYHHQRFIAAFASSGSSANNHLIAELAGQAIAAHAFPWFRESAHWAISARRQLEHEAALQTDADGFNREQAFDYHLFVFEMLFAAELGMRMTGAPASGITDVLRRMADALAISLDSSGAPPRYGDGDDGRGLVLDAHPPGGVAGHTGLLLAAAAPMVGAGTCWPDLSAHGSVLQYIVRKICGTDAAPRPLQQRNLFADTGFAILRAHSGQDEIWLRCDHGRLGYLSIAAHGHADALSLELRVGGVELLSDPGTYCYHGEPDWRRYFKGTQGHNTLALDNADQAVNGGPFLWLTQPDTKLEDLTKENGTLIWQACHNGYQRLPDAATHHRRVALQPDRNLVSIDDWLDAGTKHDAVLAYHFGPDIAVRLAGTRAELHWHDRSARIDLPDTLHWSLHKGETDPVRGWYSASFGHRVPAFCLFGKGQLAPGQHLHTQITLPPTNAFSTASIEQGHATIQ